MFNAVLPRLRHAVLIGLFVMPATGRAESLRAYVGTFTPAPPAANGHVDTQNHGEGIFLVDVDSVSGRLSNARLAAKTASPTWITVDKDGKFLYATNENAALGGSGSISAFAIDRATGALTPLNTVSSQGAGPTYINIHPSGKFLLVANYSGGSLAVLPILPDGALGEASDVVHPSGPLHPAQADDNPPGNFAISDHARSHVHMVGTDPTGRFVTADDAGLDQILFWHLDLSSGKLSPAQTPLFAARPGSAPRHFVFDPDGRRFYQLFEQDSMLGSFAFDPNTGALDEKQRLSSLPSGFAGSNLASELRISQNGRNLYAANRLHDTIAIFSVDKSGRVKSIGEEPTRGDYPRSITIDPTGRFLYSLNQNGDSITSFRIDSGTGALSFTGQFLPLGSPGVMVFSP